MMKIQNHNVTLEKPTVDNVPWIYIKDSETRLGGERFSVRLEGQGHVGFIALTEEGVKCETNYGLAFHRHHAQLRKEEAIPLVVHYWLKLYTAETGKVLKPRRPAHKPRPTLKAGVEWIARNDSPADNEPAEAVAGYVSSLLLADLFGVDPERVGRLVVEFRKTHPDCVGG